VDFDLERLERLDKHEFLTSAWFEEFATILKEIEPELVAFSVPLRMNQTVRGCPFQKEPLLISLDTSQGTFSLAPGALENPDLSVILDYEVARSLFIEAKPDRAISAFLAGQIMVTGDMTKLLSFAQAFSAPGDSPLTSIIDAITS